MSEYAEVKASPIGRMLASALFQPTTSGYQNKVIDPTNYVVLGIKKDDPEFNNFWTHLNQVAQAGFSNNEFQRQEFSWKMKDGDAPKYQGKEGYAGCWVFTFSSQAKYFRGCVDKGHQPIIDQNQLKNGYYVRVGYSAVANGDTNKPGLFLNVVMVQKDAEGPEIFTGPSASQIFGAPQVMPATPAPPQNQQPQVTNTPAPPQNQQPQVTNTPAPPQNQQPQVTNTPAPPQNQQPPVTNTLAPPQNQGPSHPNPNYDFLNGPQGN